MLWWSMKLTRLQFQPDESLPVALQRLVVNQRQEAAKWAAQNTRPTVAVHRIRLALKFLRTLLKLAQKATGVRFFAKENSRLRKAAAKLSPWRDEIVIQRTLKKISGKVPSKHYPTLSALKSERKKSHRAPPKKQLHLAMQNAADSIQITEKLLARLILKTSDWKTIEDGLVKSYHEVSRSLAETRPTDTDESFHEHRKATKHLFYVITLFEPVWPGRLTPLKHKLKKLQELLGKDHDLAVVREALKDSKTVPAKNRAELVKILLRRNRGMRKDIRKRAEKIFAGHAKNFTKKFTCHFSAWQLKRAAAS